MDAAITLTGPAGEIAEVIKELHARYIRVEAKLDAAIREEQLDGLNAQARAVTTRESWGVIDPDGALTFFHDDTASDHDAKTRAETMAGEKGGHVVRVTVLFRVIKVERV